MATYAAIAATSQAIVGLPETAAKGDLEFGTASALTVDLQVEGEHACRV